MSTLTEPEERHLDPNGCGETMTLIQTEVSNDGTTREHLVAFVCQMHDGHKPPVMHMDQGIEDQGDTQFKWVMRWTVEKD